MHRGHRYLIEQLHAAAGGSRPLVVTFPDHPVAMLAPERAPKLLTLAPEKRRLLEAENVDVAMMKFDRAFAATSARDFIRRLRGDYDVERLLLGYNNRFGADRGLSHDDYKIIGAEEGVEVVTARPFTIPVSTDDETARLNVSSTAIRQMLDRGDLATANRMLGRSFSLSGIVESGQQLGRTIDFPTANLQVDERLCVPATGVYLALARLEDGSEHPAVVNIGYRPTVDKSAEPRLSIEAHLLDYAGNLYGQPLTLLLIDRLRGERRFDSIDFLRRQIASDVAAARRHFAL